MYGRDVEIYVTDLNMRNFAWAFQDRNFHNKIFGGFLMRQALELGWLTAYCHWYVYNGSTTFLGTFLELTKSKISYADVNIFENLFFFLNIFLSKIMLFFINAYSVYFPRQFLH